MQAARRVAGGRGGGARGPVPSTAISTATATVTAAAAPLRVQGGRTRALLHAAIGFTGGGGRGGHDVRHLPSFSSSTALSLLGVGSSRRRWRLCLSFGHLQCGGGGRLCLQAQGPQHHPLPGCGDDVLGVLHTWGGADGGHLQHHRALRAVLSGLAGELDPLIGYELDAGLAILEHREREEERKIKGCR